MKIQWSLEGAKELKHNIKRAKFDILSNTNKALYEEAQAIMKESLSEVPRATGTLASAAYLEKEADGQIVFGYGGEKASSINPNSDKSVEDYMVAVHERLDRVHPQGKAKFLEDPINRHRENLDMSLTSRLKRLLKF